MRRLFVCASCSCSIRTAQHSTAQGHDRLSGKNSFCHLLRHQPASASPFHAVFFFTLIRLGNTCLLQKNIHVYMIYVYTPSLCLHAHARTGLPVRVILLLRIHTYDPSNRPIAYSPPRLPPPPSVSTPAPTTPPSAAVTENYHQRETTIFPQQPAHRFFFSARTNAAVSHLPLPLQSRRAFHLGKSRFPPSTNKENPRII